MISTINIQIKNFPISADDIEREANKHLAKRSSAKLSFEIKIVGISKIKSLNLKYLKKDQPTDVLSFPLPKIPGENSVNVGIIFLCSDIIKKSAEKQGKNYREEFLFILRHGIDHLLGVHHK